MRYKFKRTDPISAYTKSYCMIGDIERVITSTKPGDQHVL